MNKTCDVAIFTEKLAPTSSAISLTSARFAHCSSSVRFCLPISQEAKPHCGLRYNLSRGMYFAASWIRAITACFILQLRLLCGNHSENHFICPLSDFCKRRKATGAFIIKLQINRRCDIFFAEQNVRPRSHRGHCWHKLNGNCPCRQWVVMLIPSGAPLLITWLLISL